MTFSQKIRVALIGLNAPFAGTPTGTNWAASAHLPYLLTSKKYQLVALQNSSAEKATRAIQAYGLDPGSVRAYGTPEELASDPNIDMVVSCIRVDRHAGSVIPAIKAGKDVFVEWPLEANTTKAKELVDLVNIHKVRNVVGLQGRYNPLARKLKDMIARGDIGRLEGSTVSGHAYGGFAIPSPVEYFTDKDVGGNQFVIVFSHSMEFVTDGRFPSSRRAVSMTWWKRWTWLMHDLSVLGEVTTFQSLLVNQYPTVSITEPTTNKVIDPTRPNDVPNQICFNAILESGAVLTFNLRGVPSPSPNAKPRSGGIPKTPSLEWRIFGSKGQIRITSYDQMLNTWSLDAGPDRLIVEVYDVESDTITPVDTVEDNFQDLPLPARNIARLYEAFASESGAGEEHWYPDFQYALERHERIDKMYEASGF